MGRTAPSARSMFAISTASFPSSIMSMKSPSYIMGVVRMASLFPKESTYRTPVVFNRLSDSRPRSRSICFLSAMLSSHTARCIITSSFRRRRRLLQCLFPGKRPGLHESEADRSGKEEIAQDCQLHDQDGGHSENEASVSGFMSKSIHADDTADTSSDDRCKEEIGFRNPVCSFSGTPLINAHFGKTHYIYYYNIKRQNENNIHMEILLWMRGSCSSHHWFWRTSEL